MALGRVQKPVSGLRRGIESMYWSSAVHSALDFVEGLDLPLPEKPMGPDGQVLNPRLPHDITRLTSDQLGRLYGEFSAIAVYAETHAGLSDVEHADEEYKYDVGEAREGLQTEGENKEQRTWLLKTNTRVRAMKEQALARRARKVLMAALLRGYEKAINALSREMSRRGLDLATKT